jgi:hypothetical protein
MHQFRQALRLIERSGEGDFTGPIPQQIVEDAEELLGVRFPPSYRQFLLKLGCGDVAGAEFYGIVDDNLAQGPIPNGIWLTLDERENGKLPPKMVLVGFTGMSGYYALDLSRAGENREAPVVMWQAGAPAAACPIIAKDFGTFFLDEVSSALGEDAPDDDGEDDDDEDDEA